MHTMKKKEARSYARMSCHITVLSTLFNHFLHQCGGSNGVNKGSRGRVWVVVCVQPSLRPCPREERTCGRKAQNDGPSTLQYGRSANIPATQCLGTETRSIHVARARWRAVAGANENRMAVYCCDEYASWGRMASL